MTLKPDDSLNKFHWDLVFSEIESLEAQIIELRKATNPFVHPNFGACLRCATSWGIKLVGRHITHFAEGHGCFPLCEPCWQILATPEARLPFYRALVDSWLAEEQQKPKIKPDSASQWPLIEAAVLAGK